MKVGPRLSARVPRADRRNDLDAGRSLALGETAGERSTKISEQTVEEARKVSTVQQFKINAADQKRWNKAAPALVNDAQLNELSVSPRCMLDSITPKIDYS